MKIDEINDQLRGLSILEAEDIISELSSSDIISLLDQDLPVTIQTVAVLHKFDLDRAVKILELLGHHITKYQLFDNSYSEENKKQMLGIFKELVNRILETVSVEMTYYTSLDEYEDHQLYVKIARVLSYLQVNDSFEDDLYEQAESIFVSICSVIVNPDFIKLLYENSISKKHVIIEPLKKQLSLLYVEFLDHDYEEDIQYYDYLQSKKVNLSNLELKSVEEVPFDVVYNILSVDLLPHQIHEIITSIEDQERLIALIQLDALVGVRDKILRKLNSQSKLRLINDYKFYDILHHLPSEELHTYFYEIESIEAKAVIAKRIKSNTLAFETLQAYFEDYGDVYLTSALVKDLFLLLKLKQLALFRLSLPNEYHQLLRDMIREKEKQERNDNSYFA